MILSVRARTGLLLALARGSAILPVGAALQDALHALRLVLARLVAPRQRVRVHPRLPEHRPRVLRGSSAVQREMLALLRQQCLRWKWAL